MATYIKELYEELFVIRQYLIKIGPSRRQGNILQKKLSEAKLIGGQYNTYIENIKKVGRLDEEENILIRKCCEDFNNLFKEITKLCEYSESLDYVTKMDKFDLKVALTLLPVMNDEISNTKQLMDGIEYYSSVINAESQSQLISFILKSRLSQSAKLKLGTNYDTVPNLINDMRKLLLPKKSASALQKQFLNCKQNNLSIDAFGKMLSEMFVELTVSQSDGDSEKFNVLKSINEKQAIRQFSDGLRNRRIGTIITAQNFDNLKDAIQAGVDEDVSGSDNMAEVMAFRRNNNRNFKNNSRQPQYQNYQRGTYNAGRGRGSSNWHQPRGGARQWFQQPPSRGHTSRGRHAYRGNSSNNNYRAQRQFREQIRLVNDDSQSQPQASTSTQIREAESEFFRA